MKHPSALVLSWLLLAALPAWADDGQDKIEQERSSIPYFVDHEFASPVTGINQRVSKKLFDRQNHVTDKAIVQLKARRDGEYEDNKLYIGGRFIGSVISERTNTSGKFPILSRLPPTHTSGNSDTYDVINDASVNATVTLPWITGFVQGEYTDVEYPGQDQKQIRKYFVTLGDLREFPLYLSVGKKTVAFGDMSSYAPFTHSHNSHYFWAQTDDALAELGYVGELLGAKETWIAGSLIKNDRGTRVVNAPDGDGYENFALNVRQTYDLEEYGDFTIGTGFLRGTIYDSTLAHHPPAAGLQDRFWASAWNLNAMLVRENWDFMAEYTTTIDEWPATDSLVQAITLQTRYRDTLFDVPTVYSAMFSEGLQGESGDEWRSMSQLVLGIEAEIFPGVEIGAEYLLNHGFVPLILPRITADDGVVSHTAIVGVKFTF